MASKSSAKIPPANSIGILPLQEAVLFPNTVIPLAVVKKPGILLVEEALREGKPIGLTVLKDREIENPGPNDIQPVGTVGVRALLVARDDMVSGLMASEITAAMAEKPTIWMSAAVCQL